MDRDIQLISCCLTTSIVGVENATEQILIKHLEKNKCNEKNDNLALLLRAYVNIGKLVSQELRILYNDQKVNDEFFKTIKNLI